MERPEEAGYRRLEANLERNQSVQAGIARAGADNASVDGYIHPARQVRAFGV
jgi:hypothetical protein